MSGKKDVVKEGDKQQTETPKDPDPDIIPPEPDWDLNKVEKEKEHHQETGGLT